MDRLIINIVSKSSSKIVGVSKQLNCNEVFLIQVDWKG